jgi:alkanesulfonate monooxygenase SsuD/methylene tetrahydromethanopterin reductase-like flavin-dependent oxidoreductase (luciferase family)
MRLAPVQQPRVPVWVGGTSCRRGPARRAALWDGSVPIVGAAWEQPLVG